MGSLIDAIEYLGIPGTIGVVIIALFLVSQIIGELVELSGKVVPEFLKIRKYFKRKKEEEIERKMRATERLNQTIERNSSVVNDIYETKRRTKKKDDYER